VPEITPVPLLRLRPDGNDPTVIDQLSGGVPPVAANVWLYPAVSVAPGRVVVVIVNPVFTVIDKA
jgi:hypothetical protein